jgi:hypothetical protein
VLLLVAERCDVTVDDDNQMGWDGLESESSGVEGLSGLSCLVSVQAVDLRANGLPDPGKGVANER